VRAEEYRTRDDVVAGWRVRITCYRLADRYYASVDNIDPGAKFARADAASREEAEAAALDKATRRLASTRAFRGSGAARSSESGMFSGRDG